MKETSATDYARIASAIEFISASVDRQPSLDEIASHVHLSPFHFQRLFSRWAGVTPKQFLQALTVEKAKRLMEQSQSLLDVSNSVGLSSSSRLHDHFVTIEAITPGEYKSRGLGLTIEYGMPDTPFGQTFVAFTERGMCRMSFMEGDSGSEELADLKATWPNASIVENAKRAEEAMDSVFNTPKDKPAPLSLHISGTNFQINVWKSLLKIPSGQLVSYSDIATAIDKPKAVRAVGTAIGANPVGFFIPCHRVIRQTGNLGGYRWGLTRKQALITWETLQNNLLDR